MNAVGKLGGYLSRGVITVSAPFSGAVDIVVVQQQDGSYKSSPWYIQFGKYQGALQASDKVVNINVNGVDADFLMYLDGKGGAHFLREVDGDEGMSESVSSSGDSTDGSSTIRPQKIMSLKLDSESAAKNKKIMTRSSSIGPRVLGFVFGRRSWKENGLQHRENIVAKDIEASLEHAEMTADLLEVRWSTSLVTRKHRKNIAGEISDQRSSRRPHDKGEAEIPLSSSPANYMESFTLKETYFDVNVLESSVGSDGGDTETNSNSVKSDSGVMSGGDEQSSTSQAVRTGDERRMERVESSLYCDTSENFMDELDGSSGESSEDLCLISPVSGKMDVPTGPYGHEKLVFEMNSESPSSILACELFINTDPCISVDGSSSDSGIGSDVETLLETKVAVVLERETNEGPVRYVEEMVVDHISSSEEISSSIVESLENLRSQKTSDSTSTHLYKIVSCENNENPAGNTKTPNRDAFKVLTTNAGVTEKTDGGQFLSSDRGSYELQKIESMAYMSADSDTEESNSLDFSKSSEYKVGLLTEKRNETQFFVTDLDGGSELTKTNDTQATILNSLETENASQYKPKSKEKLGESTGMLNESHSFPVDTIGIAHEQVCQTAQRVKSLPNIWSHEAGMNAEGTNHPIRCSLDSSFDNMRLAQAGVPTTSETGEQKRHSTARPFSMDQTPITEALKKVLSNPAVEVSLCRHLLYEGMGQEATAQAFEAEKLDLEKLVSRGADIIRNDRVVVRIGDHYFSWDAALPIISAIGSSTGGQILEPKGMITVDQFENDSESMNSRPSITTIATASPRETTGITDSPKSESIKKRMVWSKTPTSEQLASLNLKEGRNDVTFTFSTPTIGEQKVDARIYLWKWNANIVISDVDGTITKSDVLGQFMPLVGVDWSQPGVAHLFSAIKENGYELLFLSARAISQASLTRQFLCNLKQDGKTLPEGPVVISPDGLLPSLYREVIIRAPHKFKIACLEDIRALFPPDHNPFYAGFGNRDTDELSYVKVGVPAGKVFIINPKGEVAVQRRVDRKTYTSLKTIVHEMFPPPSSDSSAVKEDFNEFHFWRLPPSEIVD